VTPIRRQYLKIKHSYPDAIVLFRLGDFYETFDADAHLAANELEITLTSRSMGKNVKVPMAGVPAHALDSYLAQLIKKGHKVAICEQLTEPSHSRGLVERDVVRVVTPGTVVEPGLLDQKSNNYLAAVVEENGWAGLACVDVTTGEFSATQLESAGVGLELERIAPAEVLAPGGEPLENNGESPADTPGGWRENPRSSITPMDPAAFDLNTCREAILSHYGILSLESFGCDNLPLAVRAAGAIFAYLTSTHKANLPRLSPLGIYSTSAYMALDQQTKQNLELFQAGRGHSSEHSLLAVLDQTRTAMGARLLRRWLGQPLLDPVELNRRLDVVDSFHADGFRRASATAALSRIADLERIVGRIQAGASPPRDLIALKTGLAAAGELVDSIGDSADTAWLRPQLAPVSEAPALIAEAIADEPTGNPGEGGVIRPGFSAELDRLKTAGSDARRFIAGLEQQERERTGIRSLKVGYNQVFGYYIEVAKSGIPQVPEDYVRRQTLANGERYVIPELKEYESMALTARDQIEELERDLYRRVCAQLSESAAAIQRLARGVAQADALASLASVAVANRYVRPAIGRGHEIRIKEGRHPVVERTLDGGRYVPNDVHLSSDDARIIVLTGPNMAGKSTYIRQVAIIVLMAQIGSFVPASEATIGLVDRIFTRVGLQDDLTTGQSTFMVEMVETAAILNQATPRSLVVLDEIGRGTSTYDGLSIARSVIEHLHNDERLGCKTLFATHYHELTELAGTLPGVRNFTVAVTEEDGDVVFLHRIVPGGADKSYGVHVARLAGLPQGVVNRAWEVLADLEDNHNSKRKAGGRRSRKAADLQMPLFDPARAVADEVKALDIPNLTPLEAINCLYELQRKARELTGSS
jgi:DNA mismatch repair protein MutS